MEWNLESFLEWSLESLLESNLESFLESILNSILPIYNNTKETQKRSNELKNIFEDICSRKGTRTKSKHLREG
jgi:hypothetical protein